MGEQTSVEEHEKARRTTAEEQVRRVKIKVLVVHREAVEIDRPWQLRWLLAQDVQRHDAAEGMRHQMHSAVLLEPGVVLAPQPIDAVRLAYDGLDHLGLVMRQIVRYVQHDVGDQVAHRRERAWRDVLETEVVV